MIKKLTIPLNFWTKQSFWLSYTFVALAIASFVSAGLVGTADSISGVLLCLALAVFFLVLGVLCQVVSCSPELVRYKEEQEEIKKQEIAARKERWAREQAEIADDKQQEKIKSLEIDGGYRSVKPSSRDFKLVFELVFVSHLDKLGKDLSKQGNDHLFSLRAVMNDLADLASQKMAQCLKDGQGHSIMVGKQGGILINVSCWPCGLDELKAHFEREIGSYKTALAHNHALAKSKGFSAFTHIFVCDDSQRLGITMTYADTDFQEVAFPTELQ